MDRTFSISASVYSTRSFSSLFSACGVRSLVSRWNRSTGLRHPLESVTHEAPSKGGRSLYTPFHKNHNAHLELLEELLLLVCRGRRRSCLGGALRSRSLALALLLLPVVALRDPDAMQSMGQPVSRSVEQSIHRPSKLKTPARTLSLIIHRRGGCCCSSIPSRADEAGRRSLLLPLRPLLRLPEVASTLLLRAPALWGWIGSGARVCVAHAPLITYLPPALRRHQKRRGAGRRRRRPHRRPRRRHLPLLWLRDVCVRSRSGRVCQCWLSWLAGDGWQWQMCGGGRSKKPRSERMTKSEERGAEAGVAASAYTATSYKAIWIDKSPLTNIDPFTSKCTARGRRLGGGGRKGGASTSAASLVFQSSFTRPTQAARHMARRARGGYSSCPAAGAAGMAVLVLVLAQRTAAAAFQHGGAFLRAGRGHRLAPLVQQQQQAAPISSRGRGAVLRGAYDGMRHGTHTHPIDPIGRSGPLINRIDSMGHTLP